MKEKLSQVIIYIYKGMQIFLVLYNFINIMETFLKLKYFS